MKMNMYVIHTQNIILIGKPRLKNDYVHSLQRLLLSNKCSEERFLLGEVIVIDDTLTCIVICTSCFKPRNVEIDKNVDIV